MHVYTTSFFFLFLLSFGTLLEYLCGLHKTNFQNKKSPTSNKCLPQFLRHKSTMVLAFQHAAGTYTGTLVPPHRDALDFMNFLEEATPYRSDTLLGAFCSTTGIPCRSRPQQNRLVNLIRELQLAQSGHAPLCLLLHHEGYHAVADDTRRRLDNPIHELQKLAEHEEVGIVELLYRLHLFKTSNEECQMTQTSKYHPYRIFEERHGYNRV